MMMPTTGRTMPIVALITILAVAFGCSGKEAPPKADSASRQPTGRANERSAQTPPTAQDRGATAKAAQPPMAEPKRVAKANTPAEEVANVLERVARKPADLGPPLVGDVKSLQRLDPVQPVWLDAKNKQIVLQGEACRAGYPLEFFATYSNRSYEAVVAVNVTPSIVHAGLLATGAEAGHPAQFRMQPGKDEPEVIPPTGTEVAIEVRWKDDRGTIQSAPAQQWVRDRQTGRALSTNWVFAGSVFVTDDETGKKHYRADSGELICVLSLPGAMLDLPISNYRAMESRSFEAFAEHLPPPGTPVTLVLKPLLSKKPVETKPTANSATPASEKQTAAEKAAIEAAGPWLALVDRGEYARGWETAAEFLRTAVDRKRFVQSVSSVRKPLGTVKSRELQSRQYTTQMPGAPDGQYVRLEYKTSFANKATAVETVTPMLDADKKWRVSGYYVK